MISGSTEPVSYTHLAVLHFIEEGSKTDHIDDKLKYINPIFDLYYYISSNNLSSDVDPQMCIRDRFIMWKNISDNVRIA